MSKHDTLQFNSVTRILFIALLTYSSLNTTLAQDIAWLTVFEERTVTNNMDNYANGDFLMSGIYRDTKAGFLTRINPEGEIVWEEEKAYSENITRPIFAFLNNDNTITQYYANDEYVIWDELAQDTISSGSIDFSSLDYKYKISRKQKNDKVLIYGKARKDDNAGLFYVLHDPMSIQQPSINFIETVGLLSLNLDIDAQNNILIARTYVDALVLSYYNSMNELEWETSHPPVHAEFLEFNENDKILLTGYSEDMPNVRFFNGHISLFSIIDGSLIWDTTIPPQAGENASFVSHAAILSDDHIFYAGHSGFVGIGPITDLQYGVLDAEGVNIWQNFKHIQGESESISSLHLIDDNTIVLAGTAGRSDFTGHENSFILKLSDLYLDTQQEDAFSEAEVYPNPVSSHLNFKMPWSSDNASYRIMNIAGDLIKEGELQHSELNVSSLAAGHYLILLQDGNDSKVIKFVKM